MVAQQYPHVLVIFSIPRESSGFSTTGSDMAESISWADRWCAYEKSLFGIKQG